MLIDYRADKFPIARIPQVSDVKFPNSSTVQVRMLHPRLVCSAAQATHRDRELAAPSDPYRSTSHTLTVCERKPGPNLSHWPGSACTMPQTACIVHERQC
eukprot:6213192-Pleurochrysis_carterae.AAC.5